MDSYQTEEEQVEAIRRWWQENGRSTIAVIVVALAAGFGWQSWKGYDLTRVESASTVYQNMLQSLNSTAGQAGSLDDAKDLAEQLKTEYSSTTYAQFAALQLAKLAAQDNKPEEAQSQLRWALSQAKAGSDVAAVAQLRLARVMASSGEPEQALEILTAAKDSSYTASYAIAEGDIYMQLGRIDEARDAYAFAKLALAQGSVEGNISTLENKIQNLNPLSARSVEVSKAVEAVDSTQVPVVEPTQEIQED
jgi:predicted negative regulator of RcsB-dependent stress response